VLVFSRFAIYDTACR